MPEYKVVTVRVGSAKEVLNRPARDGWRVASTALLSGECLLTRHTPMVMTLERETQRL